MMKRFALAVAVTAGVLFSASTADAQYRASGSYRPSYATPTYTYPTYSYAAPGYFGGVVTSGYTPEYTPTIYPGGYSYYPAGWGSPVYGSSYGSSYYTNSPMSYGSGYNGVYISPSGVNWRGRGWRW
jgi:hypothetical protein